ncbi:MAG: RNA polymerase sigma factor [Planctomycetota bacterium]|jgi:RNA polymerase sigma-70 factor (ECF subfamily)
MRHERSHLEDQLLVMDAQDGSRDAMDQLVARWQKRLWRHARRLTGDEQGAWDVTQSAWYDIIRKLRKLHDPSSFPAWAYTITTRRAVDWIKKKQRSRSVPLDSLETVAPVEKNDSEIEELLNQLDIDKRTILSLYYFEQLSIADIAAAMKVPTGTVKSRLHTARNALKQKWLKAAGKDENNE